MGKCLWENANGKKCFNHKICISYHGQMTFVEYVAETNGNQTKKRFNDNQSIFSLETGMETCTIATTNSSDDSKEDNVFALVARNKRQYNKIIEQEVIIGELKEKVKKLSAVKKKWETYKSKLGYVVWDSEDIFEWIMGLEDGLFVKYDDILLDNLKREQVSGEDLCSFNENDLDRFGITGFKDKKILLSHLKKLTAAAKDKRNEVYKKY